MESESTLPNIVYDDGHLRLVERRDERGNIEVILEDHKGPDALGVRYWVRRTGKDHWMPPMIHFSELLRILKNVGAYHPTVPAK